MRISDWSSDVGSSDLRLRAGVDRGPAGTGPDANTEARMRAKTETAEPQAQTGTRLAVGTGRALRDDEIVVAAGERQLGRVIQQIILDRLPRRRRAAGEGHAIAIAFNALVLIAVDVAHRDRKSTRLNSSP